MIGGCSNQKTKAVKKRDSSNVKNNISTSTEKKAILQEKITKQYFKITPLLFFSNDGKNYSNYKEVEKLDSLFSVYEKIGLSKKERQLLAIAKAKRQLSLTFCTSAIEELNKVHVYPPLENYKNLLRAIAYEMNGNHKKAMTYFKPLISYYENHSMSNPNCRQYFIIKALSGSEKLKICKNKRNKYRKMKQEGKIALIKEHILTYLRL